MSFILLYDLINLLEDINKIDGIERIRIGSIEPKLLNSENLERMKKINKVKYCKTQYEIDMEKDKARYFKQYKESSNINRLYEILPEYVVKAFARKK